MNELSNCHNATVIPVAAADGTKYNLCSECKAVCDTHEASALNLASLIERERAKRGWTQAHLALIMGMHTSSYSHMMAGQYKDIGARILQRSYAVLGIPAETLLTCELLGPVDRKYNAPSGPRVRTGRVIDQKMKP